MLGGRGASQRWGGAPGDTQSPSGSPRVGRQGGHSVQQGAGPPGGAAGCAVKRLSWALGGVRLQEGVGRLWGTGRKFPEWSDPDLDWGTRPCCWPSPSGLLLLSVCLGSSLWLASQVSPVGPWGLHTSSGALLGNGLDGAWRSLWRWVRALGAPCAQASSDHSSVSPGYPSLMRSQSPKVQPQTWKSGKQTLLVSAEPCESLPRPGVARRALNGAPQ